MKPIAWIVYGSLAERTGGTIYDAIVVDGLGRDAVEVVSIAAGEDRDAIVERVRGARVVVGDELCFRELAEVFPRLTSRRVLLVHHLTCWEEELPAAERDDARRLELAAVHAADHVVATSKTTAARLRAEGFERRIAVVHPGSDRLPRLPRATPDAPTFLFVGSLIPRKRVAELIQAFHTAPAARLRLAGSAERDPEYAAEVRACAAGLDVTLLGEIDEATLAQELARATALVMPSSLEGYGIAATEAIAAGVPVIAARTAGLEEALAPCPEAVRFFDDVPALGATLAAVATDAALAAHLNRAASEARMPRWSGTVAYFRAELGS